MIAAGGCRARSVRTRRPSPRPARDGRARRSSRRRRRGPGRLTVLGIRRCRTRRTNGTRWSRATSTTARRSFLGALRRVAGPAAVGFRIAALVRPPDATAGEDAALGSSARDSRPRRARSGSTRTSSGRRTHDRTLRRRTMLRRCGTRPLATRAWARVAILLWRRLVRRRGSSRCARGAPVRRLHGHGLPPVVPGLRCTSARRSPPRPGSSCVAAGACSSFRRRTRIGMAARAALGSARLFTSMSTSTTRTPRRSRRTALQLALEVLARRATSPTSSR